MSRKRDVLQEDTMVGRRLVGLGNRQAGKVGPGVEAGDQPVVASGYVGGEGQGDGIADGFSRAPAAGGQSPLAWLAVRLAPESAAALRVRLVGVAQQVDKGGIVNGGFGQGAIVKRQRERVAGLGGGRLQVIAEQFDHVVPVSSGRLPRSRRRLCARRNLKGVVIRPVAIRPQGAGG